MPNREIKNDIPPNTIATLQTYLEISQSERFIVNTWTLRRHQESLQDRLPRYTIHWQEQECLTPTG